MKIPYFCCIGAELKRYAKDFDFMNQVYLYKVPADDTMEEVFAQDYFQAVADTVLQDDIVYIYEPTTEMLYACHFNKQNGHITAEQMANNIPSLTPDKILISDATGHITAGDVSLDFVKNKLTDLENNKVNIDGTSTMTGPLKFKAGSFEGAIAGGLGDGISIYKLKADGTIDSEVASITKTNGFEPGTTNSMNMGSSALKWKDAYIARVITAVLNNGYDIAVPVTNGPDTLALKSEVDNAANSGRMITDTGVWYAKMYSASTVPTGAEYDGTNYADFSQTDGDGNPVIKIYTGASGTWTLTDTITPPANYDGYVPVTKKIWDIVEQTGQQGGRVLWNHQSKTFTPYPNVVDLSSVATTDLDNLTSQGQNIANWSSNITNCITEIPQDIKLELSSGTLTLKAGSKCYLKTDTTTPSVNIVSDLTTTQSTNGTYFAIYNGSALTTVLPTTYDYSSLPSTYSLPLAVITVSGGVISSIDQVFNGFGYIGSTLFVLPGVKGIAPNGRNTDGTLKNTVVEITTVKTINNLTSNLGYTVAITNNGLSYFLYREYSQETYPGTNYKAWYKPSENILYNTMTAQGAEQIIVGATICYFNSITGEFIPKQAFRSLDYNDTNFIVHQSMPSDKYIDLTLGASGNSYTAPADGYVYFRKDATAVGQYFVLYGSNIQVVNKSATSGGYIAGYIPVKNGETFKVEYNLAGSTVVFKFVYAQGAI